MNAILIDVTAQTVTDIDLETGLDALYKAIGCDCVDRLVLDDRNDLWLDDNGLITHPQPPKFLIGNYPHPLAGNAVIAGYTASSRTVSTSLRADQVRPLIRFLDTVYVPPQPFVILDWDV